MSEACMDDDRPRYRTSLEQSKEDLLDKLVAEMRERGVEANVDPRMDFEQPGIAFLTFYGAAGEPEPDLEETS